MRAVYLALTLIVLPSFLAAEDAVRRLSLTGLGEVFVTPDMATLNLGVSTLNKKASDAMRENSATMRQIFDMINAAGVEPRDIQTSQLSLNPRWDHRNSANKPVIIGYDASNTVTIRVRALETVGDVLDILTQAGVNQINAIHFGIQKQRPHQDEARKRAVADAQAKAELYAKAAGVTLGQVISINENGGVQNPRPMARMAEAAMMSDAVPVAEGELGLRANVTMVFEIK